ncbi:restriction endonuclease subunit S [Pseudoalteromonas luteoviolacea]|uniref:restriction endonuclease subunit S n=1 Tax=Pseudoalteromonas luteoviolacea TaxID=43657 RepID=UPI001B38814F|nr:restriction endonuclease subunit S [Pseudoalteromonas luteoviolacea]MBQ4837353.1 restriction endonuclease subunit S [Pseudoalteromonas luteoviolacea]
MSKYKPYPEYKDSQDSLLGDVPKHWQLTRVKYVAELTPKKPMVDRSIDCSFIPMEKLKTDSIILDETKKVGDVYDGYTYFADGDILLAKVTPCFENKNIAIASGLKNKIGFGSSEIYTIRASVKVDKRFLFYRLQEDGFMDMAIGSMTGAGGLKRVPSETITNYTYASPSEGEQTQIANYLDHETAKIDTLIEKQQQLIKLLKEKRQAVISHAVTKGLNPEVRLKDSGVEWLGDVPEHWRIKRLRYLGTCQNGINIGADSFGSGYPFISYGDAYKNEVLPENGSGLVQSTEQDREIYSVKTGDVIFTRTSETVEEIGFSSTCLKTVKDATFAGFLIRFRPETDALFSGFSKYYFRSSLMRVFFIKEMNLVTRASLSQDLLKKLSVALPPINEQKKIAEYLDKQSDAFDKLVLNAELSIQLLNERRTALISAAVTGKIDVRNWKKPKVSEEEVA